MNLENTTILSIDDIGLARQQFQKLVCGRDALVIVVLGNDDKSEKAVESADIRSSVVVAGINRRVVWIKDRTVLSSEINNLRSGKTDISTTDLNDLIAISVSLDTTTMGIVKVTDQINNLKMEMLFLEAGQAWI